MVTAAKKSEDDYFCQESYDKFRQCVEKQRHYSANKHPYSQGYGPPGGHVGLWEVNRKEGKVPKNWCLRTVMLEKTPESPLDSKESNQEGLMLKLKRQYFGYLMWTDDSLKKSLMLGKTEASEDEMAG